MGPKPFQKASDQIFDNIASTLVVFLDTYLLPVIVDYIQQHRRPDNTPQNSSCYDAFFEGGAEKTLERFEQYYSPIMQALHQRCRLFTTHFNQACDRIFSDWEEIKSKFAINDEDTLYYTRFFCGDPHGQGGQTSIITFNQGTKGFVYKPIDLSIIKFFHSVLAYVEEEFGFSCKKIPSVILKKSVGSINYGYINFIPYQGHVKNREEAASVYENFGKILGFARFFKVADGHADNIFIQVPDVFWIDLENAFHFTTAATQQDVQDLEVTGLLVEAKKETTMLGIFTGLQGGTLPRLNLTQPIAYQDGTDDMFIKYFAITDVSNEEKRNRVFLNGILCYPEDYSENIKKGFYETIKNLIIHKHAILNFICAYLREHTVIVRHIFKPTAFYNRYINLTNHIIALKKGDVLYQIRKELNELTAEQEPFRDFVISHEIRDICNGVIPYFYQKSSDNNIYHACGLFQKNYFENSLFDNFSDHIEKINIETIDRDLVFIDKALNSTREIKTWEDFKNKFDYPVFDYEQQLTELEKAS